jgi:hypothetical protein
MTIYFFHLCNGVDVLLDPDGRELEPGDVASAAMTEARAIVAADARSGHIDLDQRIDVEDGLGKLVHRLLFEDAIHIQLSHPAA